MKYILVFVVFLIATIFSCTKGKRELSGPALQKKIDSIVQPYLDSGKIAGLAVAVFKKSERLFVKSYGYADLEFDVKLPVDASFEIGSVTKQFTSAAILQLAEQGKLALDDDITKFIAFNTQGKKVTIRHLLSHTSGIKGYTELPFFEEFSKLKFERDSLLRRVEKEPFTFEPGSELIYNNTGFFMLGLIIEKVSGVSYEDYVVKNLFQKAGMTNSYYCSEQKVVRNRAHGYDAGEEGLVRAQYLDHTWPYAAGSLCSSVEDLVKWNDALHHGRILGKEMYQEFITPAVLTNGAHAYYAKGVVVMKRNGMQLIEHGGAINGFLSQNSYFPEEDISVVVLMNTLGSLGTWNVADPIIEFLIGKQAIETHSFKGDLSKFTGIYKGAGRGSEFLVRVIRKDSTIAVQRGENSPKKLKYSEENLWNDGFTTYQFVGTGDSLNELRINETYGYYILKKGMQ